MADGARSSHGGVQAQLDRLSALGMGGDILGLERIGELCRRLNDPQDRLPPVFHVAGTNGKGSTIAFLRAAFEAGGRPVHVFTSPHLVRFNERIRLAGELIGDAPLADLLEEVIDAAAGMKASFFEISTAAAFLAFSRTPADACLIEVGLGGRLDATNVIPAPAATGIAGLGLDHQAFLGDRLDRIALEKAGIAKRGVPLVMQSYPPEIESLIVDHALSVGAKPVIQGRDWDIERVGAELVFEGKTNLTLPLPRLEGAHQFANAGLAAAMLQYQDALSIEPEAVASMTERASWPARLQKLDKGNLAGLLPNHELWLDGGHNEDAARALARFFDGRKLHLVFGLLANRDPSVLLAPFEGLVEGVTALPIHSHEHHEPAMLADEARRILGIEHVGTASDAEQAISLLSTDIAGDHAVLVFGSLYLAGEVLEANGTLPD
ncbi:bifunctional folylpolyglutamate synthase/dihydrofolate synthase [Sphingomicrobium lutaoense]|uniref:Dihydrofolate synthase/folylpolyglutamate synthase n=1 Tax=Sphingomicrobium lutaoense TaxID=515949 RepID=A0A839Z3K6_9SPHN|nr:folylpolyglutamate synthase/dihydrofolate synthase family protein [Sphingomicrobium lutaoense]MBB3764155.1 dihydrofolate synthase/folylpolyglutamate synthase [Sphingomicrobium lutaoense]